MDRFLSFEINPQPAILQAGRAPYSGQYADQLADLKEKVNTAKRQLDSRYKTRGFPGYWRMCDPFVNEKDTVAQLGDTFNVSNAWIKCYEIQKYYSMIPERAAQFIHFDNAAFPGSFILATHHYIATQRNWLDNYTWRANSLIENNEYTSTQLEDKYHLYKNYPSNWMMSATNNGDVLKPQNQRDFSARIGGQVDLYTSDLGFDVSSDYDNQELMQAHANIGQILSGLLTLKRGGCLITKQYSIFEPITLSVIYMTAQFFDKLYVAKPYTSREANTEIYLVGIGFHDGPQEYLDIMFKGIVNRDDAILQDLPGEFMRSICHVSQSLSQNTINKVNADVARCDRAMTNGWRGPAALNPLILEYIAYEAPYITAWYKKNYINPIDDQDRLKITDIWQQRQRAAQQASQQLHMQ